jgi:Adenylate and Guanylate cyclase catalytic domain
VTALPSGTVTFLFTDVQGSTRLLRELGDRYADVLLEHRRVLREAFARYGGVEVDTQGDAFFFAFAKASDALAAAAEGRDALAAGPVRVRMGLLHESQSELAGKIWGAVEAATAFIPGGPWPRDFERLRAEVLKRADDAFERGREAGQALSLEDAAALVREQ